MKQIKQIFFGRWESDFKFDWLIIFLSRIRQESWKFSTFFISSFSARFFICHDCACSVLKSYGIFCPRRNFNWMENDLKACNFTESDTPPWVFFTSFKIVQMGIIKLYNCTNGPPSGQDSNWQKPTNYFYRKLI